MANLINTRPAGADLGGKNLHDHQLMYDAPTNLRYSDQRASSDDSAHAGTHHTGDHGSGQSTSEETANGDDEEEGGSTGKEDDQEDEEDDADIMAPSHGRGKGKGKRPAIRVEPAGDDESQDEEAASIETGRKTSKHPVNCLLNGNKKRTFSNVSHTSLLFGDESRNSGTFPRPKVARTLSHSGGSGLLTYKATDTGVPNGYENAIESSDDEKDTADNAETAPSVDDDEDYSGVALISDDEDDLENIEKLEESFIIGQEQSVPLDNFSQEFDILRRASVDSNGSEFLGFDNFDGSFFTPVSMQDIGFGHFFEPEARPASPEPIAKRKFSDSSNKRVRFEDEVHVSDSASSTSEELDSATFPDLFLDQDKLPPSLYQLMEVDNDSDHGDYPSSASEHSYWDFGQDENRNLVSHEPEHFDDESSDPGSSGYETDMGDTTDEYDSDFGSDAPPRTPRQKTVLNRPSSAPGSKAPSPQPFRRSSMPAPGGRTVIPPLRGIFIHEDSRQAIAVTNRNTKTLTFYRPRASVSFRSPFKSYSSTTSTANNSPRTSAQKLNLSDSELSNDVFSNPLMNATDIMLTGIFGSAPASTYLLGGESIGPPEAFYPFINIGQNGNVISDEDEYEDVDEFEDDVNIADFMDFGSDVDATDVEQDDETDVPATPAASMVAIPGSTPAQPTPMPDTPLGRKRNTSDAMLEHFDRAGVTAFRNNQNRFRDIACLPHDPNLRASVSRPIRSGRSAETLMSPLRKRSTMPKKHGSSPFAGVTKATGRLHSSVMNGHRGPPRMGTFS